MFAVSQEMEKTTTKQVFFVTEMTIFEVKKDFFLLNFEKLS